MIDNTYDNRRLYRSPEIKEIEVKVQKLICQSLMTMPEKDFGNGGFE
ncbi:MAG: hypothetical protein MJY58_06360 [Bacteroidaceae bacterium]|nr:hypothetical protein [Bacteroidaceae bacterium]